MAVSRQIFGIEGNAVVKVIVVPKRIVNVVFKPQK